MGQGRLELGTKCGRYPSQVVDRGLPASGLRSQGYCAEIGAQKSDLDTGEDRCHDRRGSRQSLFVRPQKRTVTRGRKGPSHEGSSMWRPGSTTTLLSAWRATTIAGEGTESSQPRAAGTSNFGFGIHRRGATRCRGCRCVARLCSSAHRPASGKAPCTKRHVQPGSQTSHLAEPNHGQRLNLRREHCDKAGSTADSDESRCHEESTGNPGGPGRSNQIRCP